MASEMLYPIMPVFLKKIGFSILLIGILEGFAEAVAGLSKSWFGNVSDIMGKRMPFVRLGYFLSAISKPLMGWLISPAWIFGARTLDRLGKGIRTAPRDALLSDEAHWNSKAKIFAFHRSMDTLGAVLGPLIALTYLYFYPEDYRNLFFIAFLPGILAVVCTYVIKEKKYIKKASNYKPVSFFIFWKYFKTARIEYKNLVTALLIFSLFNSSDMFLLLKAKSSGYDDRYIIGMYIFYNLVYAAASYPLGVLADKIGLKKIVITGFFLFSIVYFGFAFATNLPQFALLFIFYGLYAAATEGISKAWISKLIPSNETATAIGTFTGMQSITLLLSSSITGFLWYQFNATIAFVTTGVVSLLVVTFIYYRCNEPL